jgi:hypothetical protein
MVGIAAHAESNRISVTLVVSRTLARVTLPAAHIVIVVVTYRFGRAGQFAKVTIPRHSFSRPIPFRMPYLSHCVVTGHSVGASAMAGIPVSDPSLDSWGLGSIDYMLAPP